MTAQMTKEEFDAEVKRHGYGGVTEICSVLLLKTGAVIRPQHVWSHLDRHGRLSPALTAAFRFLFRELERQNEKA